jgi:hypothetical protein
MTSQQLASSRSLNEQVGTNDQTIVEVVRFQQGRPSQLQGDSNLALVKADDLQQEGE